MDDAVRDVGKIKIFTLMQQVVTKYIFRGKYHATLTEWISMCWRAEARKNLSLHLDKEENLGS